MIQVLGAQMAFDVLRRGEAQAVVEHFIVGVVETHFLNFPLQAPIYLGDENKFGVVVADVLQRLMPKFFFWQFAADKFPPRIAMYFVKRKHGHIAPYTIAQGGHAAQVGQHNFARFGIEII